MWWSPPGPRRRKHRTRSWRRSWDGFSARSAGRAATEEGPLPPRSLQGRPLLSGGGRGALGDPRVPAGPFAFVSFKLPLLPHLFVVHDGSGGKVWGDAWPHLGREAVGPLPPVARGRL